jgi:xanthine dehydrogenase accessory factor
MQDWYDSLMTLKILVRGCGDVGSAVAHAFFKSDYPVLIHDSQSPSATRRKMAFCDAIFDGQAELAGVPAKHFPDIVRIEESLAIHDCMIVTTADFSRLLALLKPDVLVDARMRKHNQPEVQIALAPFTIGLGPNFVAGETVHAAIETGWNEELGNIIWQGATRPLEGEPQTIGGHARDRYVYAPAEGTFRTALQIGDPVTAGQEVARIGGIALYAPIDGMLRGLTHDGVPVAKKTKVIEVDPRCSPATVRGIGERPGRIARGVLEAVHIWEAGSDTNLWFDAAPSPSCPDLLRYFLSYAQMAAIRSPWAFFRYPIARISKKNFLHVITQTGDDTKKYFL